MNDMKLREIHLKGYKSIAAEQSIPLGELTILLGANGSGKSNLVSFFSMLNYMTTGAFQQYVGKYGVNRLLYYGSKKTESISFELRFQSEDISDTYSVKLSHGLPDRFFISGEKVSYHRADATQPLEYFVPPGNNETGLGTHDHETSRMVFSLGISCSLAGISSTGIFLHSTFKW